MPSYELKLDFLFLCYYGSYESCLTPSQFTSRVHMSKPSQVYHTLYSSSTRYMSSCIIKSTTQAACRHTKHSAKLLLNYVLMHRQSYLSCSSFPMKKQVIAQVDCNSIVKHNKTLSFHYNSRDKDPIKEFILIVPF